MAKVFPTNISSHARLLSERSFDSVLSEPGDLMVLFHAPSCDICKKIMPEFEKASVMFEENSATEKTVTLAKVDAVKYDAIAKKYGVSGYPSIRYFKGEDDVIDGDEAGRSADSVCSRCCQWLLRRGCRPSTGLTFPAS